METFDVCPNSTFQMFMKPGKKLKNGDQLVSLNFTLLEDVGSENKVNWEIELDIKGKWRSLYKTTENKGLCTFLDVVAGELWHDVQEKVGMERNKCPIKKVRKKSY